MRNGMEDTWANRHSGQGWELPSSLLQARHKQLSQAVAAGCLVWGGFAQHGPHVDETQRLSCSLPCGHKRHLHSLTRQQGRDSIHTTARCVRG